MEIGASSLWKGGSFSKAEKTSLIAYASSFSLEYSISQMACLALARTIWGTENSNAELRADDRDSQADEQP